MLNNRHPLVWGQLALLCLQSQRLDEAFQALHQAYKLELASAGLLSQLSAALLAAGKWLDAEAAVRRGLHAQETALGRKLLGDALVEQQRFEEALEAHKAALALPDATSDLRAQCKASASEILISRLNRPAEVASL